MIKIGVYSVQGDVRENIVALKDASSKAGLEYNVNTVVTPEQIMNLDAIILPGGESTVIGGAGAKDGALRAIKEKAKAGMPVLGICAGMVLLAKQASDHTTGVTGQPLLGLLDMQVERNSFGHQGRSFEADVCIAPLQIPKIHVAFIRAPSVLAVGSTVESIAEFDGKTVAVRSGKIIATAFHPELGADTSVYERFLETI
ncbi:MAG: SNO glutamine amidotransferase [Cenarchaeum symbiont of Oopsacas minuta]|nr:SNO glutamine amidotransferase [Cenarchaeum symbiont of Oopsacas minuta]